MAVSGLSSYNNALYQWQSQQLKSTGNSASNSSASSMAASLLGGNTSMTTQIASMVELTKYAMDKMGVSDDSRVTFSQITRYREQLQKEFDEALKGYMAGNGVADINALAFELDKNGTLTAIGGTKEDRLTAQGWLAKNPVFGETLLKALPSHALVDGDNITFTVSSTGRINVVNTVEQDLQTVLNSQEDLAEQMRKELRDSGIEIPFPLELQFNDDGELRVKEAVQNSEAIDAWLQENDKLAATVKEQLTKKNVDVSAVTLRLGSADAVQISVNNADLNEIQATMDQQVSVGQSIRAGLSSLGIDKNINFAIQVNDDGSITVISDHPDAAKVQQLFDANPDLAKKYRQIETLAGLDDARAAMQISPSALRKRVQIESMAAWWAGSGDANSYFGTYANQSLSLLSGLNLNI